MHRKNGRKDKKEQSEQIDMGDHVLNGHNERLEEKFISAFDDTVKAVFGEDMIKTGDSRAFHHMGHFELTYDYLPLSYTILLEHEMGFVDMMIMDSEKAHASFTHLTGYHIDICPSFKKEDIKTALLLLKNLLEENHFMFYFTQNGKLYSKNAEGIRRIKNREEH